MIVFLKFIMLNEKVLYRLDFDDYKRFFLWIAVAKTRGC